MSVGQRPNWSQELRNARAELGLSRSGAARLASVSPETIKAYETGRRKPSRELLARILTALKIEVGTRNRILTGAGFVVGATLFPPEVAPDYFYTIEQAAREIEVMPWPACVLNDTMDVVEANRLAQTLWDIDFEHEFRGPGERNLLSVASDPRFAKKVSNWDEAVGIAVSILKAHGLKEPEESSGYFASVMQHFLEGDPHYVAKFLNVWQNTPARRQMPLVLPNRLAGAGTRHAPVSGGRKHRQ
jgi:transcriptional regulator with XRE-family HTH domain